MQAINIGKELTNPIFLHPDNVHLFGEVVYVKSTSTGQEAYYCCIECPKRGKVLWQLQNYHVEMGLIINPETKETELKEKQ